MVFVEEKEILDATLITDKAFNSILKSKDSAIFAYDHVNWSFLILVIA